MRLSYTEEKIIIEFEPDDWTDPEGGAKPIQAGIKHHIGPDQGGFDYDPRRGLWVIDKNFFNEAVLRKLFELYLTHSPANIQF